MLKEGDVLETHGTSDPTPPVAPEETSARTKEETTLFLTILHTNDEHSALIPHSPAIDHHREKRDPTVGGFARLATAVQEIRRAKTQAGEPVLLVSAGDFLGGSAFSWLALGGLAPELSVMGAMGYDAVTLGNHEYDYGPSILARYLTTAGYPDTHNRTLLLATNTAAPDGHAFAGDDMIRQSGILQLENGLAVGLLGLIGREAIALAHTAGVVEFLDPHESTRAAVSELRTQGADIIVALSHSGLKADRELAREVPGVDVIVGGHCHSALHEPVEEGSTLIVQAGSLGRYLGQLELAYVPAAGRLRTRNDENRQPFLVPIDGSLSPHTEVEAAVGEHTTQLNMCIGQATGGAFGDVLDVVACSTFRLPNQPPLEETPAANFITDAMRLVAEEIIGRRVDVAVQANGNIRDAITPGTTEHARGKLSFYDLVEVVGLGCGADGRPGYPIVSAYLTGQELHRLVLVALLLAQYKGNSHFLQFSGLRYRYSLSGLEAAKVELWTAGGLQAAHGTAGFMPLERDDAGEGLYHLVTDAYVHSLLPLVAASMPHLEIVPKNDQGVPVLPSSMHELIVRHEDGVELKVWEAVVKHAADQPPGEHGIPEIPSYYRGPSGRIVMER